MEKNPSYRSVTVSSSEEEFLDDDRDKDYNPGTGKDDQEDETMSSEASEEESQSASGSGCNDASGGVGVDEEMSDSSNNNDMREEDRSRLKAPIWSCAVKVGDTAKCNFCPKVLKAIDGSTSSITKHVKSNHSNRSEVGEMIKILSLNKKSRIIQKKDQLKKKRIQSSIMNFTKRRGVLENLQKKQIDTALVKMVVTMNKPFSDIENSFFREFIFSLNRNPALPYLTENIPYPQIFQVLPFVIL